MNRIQKQPLFQKRRASGPKRSRAKNRLFWWILGAFLLMVGYIWMKVQINLQLAEVQHLEELKRRYEIENNKLEAERVRLANIGRIQKIAEEELGLVFVKDENVIEISKK
jgi:cell division protein FtsL